MKFTILKLYMKTGVSDMTIF